MYKGLWRTAIVLLIKSFEWWRYRLPQGLLKHTFNLWVRVSLNTGTERSERTKTPERAAKSQDTGPRTSPNGTRMGRTDTGMDRNKTEWNKHELGRTKMNQNIQDEPEWPRMDSEWSRMAPDWAAFFAYNPRVMRELMLTKGEISN